MKPAARIATYRQAASLSSLIRSEAFVSASSVRQEPQASSPRLRKSNGGTGLEDRFRRACLSCVKARDVLPVFGAPADVRWCSLRPCSSVMFPRP